MFIGRESELNILERCWSKQSFQMIVLYGRRRVGKTTLLAKFSKEKRCLFFTAQEQSDRDNLADFSRRVYECFGLPAGIGSFPSWEEAFDFVAEQMRDERLLFVFDEFPYAAAANPSLPSKLQIAIDHRLSSANVCLVLCGSNQGFMESDVLGKKSPLHGRRTAQIKLEPFGYLDTAKMLPGTSAEDAFKYYACVGGIPYYLSLVDTSLPFSQNMEELFFSKSGYLYSEPTMLLRQELREPATYNSVLRAIALGSNRPNEIAGKTGIAQTSLPPYLRVLTSLGIVERIVPFGENIQTSRKAIYRLKDACYDYWYRFVGPIASDIEAGAGALAASTVTPPLLADYLGRRFERVCSEWLLRQALDGKLPLPATSFGSWWGTDPATRSQTDIDVLAADRLGKKLLIGECKWRSSINESEVMSTLRAKQGLVKGYETQAFALFTKNPVSGAAQKDGQRTGTWLFVDLEELYRR